VKGNLGALAHGPGHQGKQDQGVAPGQGAICGLAGSLRALHLSIVPIDSLHYLQSGQAVMMSILGGMGTFFGPFIGAAVMLYLEDVVTTFTKHWMAVVGLVFMFFVLFFPKGIWGSILSKLHIQQGSK
jgi:branched-chain amino acid transport system permease protein